MMRKALLIPIIAFLFLTLTVPAVHSPLQTISPPVRLPRSASTASITVNPVQLFNGVSIIFLGQTHQQVSGCFNVQVILNVTSFLSGVFRISIGNFYLYQSATNLTITNGLYYTNANNTIPELIIFPNNPVILVLTFQGFCLQPAVNGNTKVLLAYDDGSRFFKTQVFP